MKQFVALFALLAVANASFLPGLGLNQYQNQYNPLVSTLPAPAYNPLNNYDLNPLNDYNPITIQPFPLPTAYPITPAPAYSPVSQYSSSYNPLYRARSVDALFNRYDNQYLPNNNYGLNRYDNLPNNYGLNGLNGGLNVDLNNPFNPFDDTVSLNLNKYGLNSAYNVNNNNRYGVNPIAPAITTTEINGIPVSTSVSAALPVNHNGLNYAGNGYNQYPNIPNNYNGINNVYENVYDNGFNYPGNNGYGNNYDAYRSFLNILPAPQPAYTPALPALPQLLPAYRSLLPPPAYAPAAPAYAPAPPAYAPAAPAYAPAPAPAYSAY